jgi:hypothetical protein
MSSSIYIDECNEAKHVHGVFVSREKKVKMNTYDNHVQEFEACYIVDDLMMLKENNMFD